MEPPRADKPEAWTELMKYNGMSGGIMEMTIMKWRRKAGKEKARENK